MLKVILLDPVIFRPLGQPFWLVTDYTDYISVTLCFVFFDKKDENSLMLLILLNTPGTGQGWGRQNEVQEGFQSYFRTTNYTYS